MITALKKGRVAMLIQKFSKDSKRGFVVGANNVTPEKLAAGAVTLSAALVISAVGGLFGTGKKKSHRAKGKDRREKKKAPLWAAALPFVFKTAKSAFEKKGLDNIVAMFAPAAEPAEQDGGIEIIDAIPISSEEEVYDHI